VIFDRGTYPDGEILTQILEQSGCWVECNPHNETLYSVEWFVDKQTGEVTPGNNNALSVIAALME
jgi:hypothetical protein